MAYYVSFSIVAAAMFVPLYILMVKYLGLPRYFSWVVAATFATGFLYLLDKILSQFERASIRVPELILNVMTIGGGFLGAWFVRLVYDHKTNIREHKGMFVILLLSTIGHCAATWWLISGGRLP